jgi:hypothetical protein
LFIFFLAPSFFALWAGKIKRERGKEREGKAKNRHKVK